MKKINRPLIAFLVLTGATYVSLRNESSSTDSSTFIFDDGAIGHFAKRVGLGSPAREKGHLPREKGHLQPKSSEDNISPTVSVNHANDGGSVLPQEEEPSAAGDSQQRRRLNSFFSLPKVARKAKQSKKTLQDQGHRTLCLFDSL